MSTSDSNSAVTPRVRRPLRTVAALGTVIGAVALAAGALAQGATGTACHHGPHHGTHAANAGPADVAAHVDQMLQHIYIETGATPAQQAQIEPLVQAAATDLMPLHDRFHAEHGRMLALLGANPIDRAGLEEARQAQLNVIDQASKEIVQLLADTAGVLTPEQRKVIADKLAAHLGVNQG